MKAKILTFSFFIIVNSVQGQTFDKLVAEADSLFNKKEYSQAVLIYKEVFGLQNENLTVFQWRSAMGKAGDAAMANGDSKSAKQFYNSAYGSLGEKFSDKIANLSNVNGSLYFSYWISNEHGTTDVNFRNCTSSIIKYVIWFQDNKTYIQGFSDCDTYKPLQVSNNNLQMFFTNNRRKLFDEDIKTVGYKASDVDVVNFEFFEGNTKSSKSFNTTYDLVEPKFSESQLKDLTLKNAKDVYINNLNTSLKAFFPMVMEAVNKYNHSISTVGDFGDSVQSFSDQSVHRNFARRLP
jgi:hypothetical protein